MARNWSKMSQEEKDVYNAKRRERYAEADAKTVLDNRVRCQVYYKDAGKANRKQKLRELPEEELMNWFFKFQQKLYDNIMERYREHPPVYGLTPEVLKARRLLEAIDFQKMKWLGWNLIKARGLKDILRDQNPGDIDDRVKNVGKRYVHSVLRACAIYAHKAKFGALLPTMGLAKEWGKCETWNKILLLLGRQCSVCFKQIPMDISIRPVKKSDPMWVIPNTPWDLEAMLDTVHDHEIVCKGCHLQLRLATQAWLKRALMGKHSTVSPSETQMAAFERYKACYPPDLTELRRINPKWIITSKKREGHQYFTPFLITNPSHEYWRDMPRTVSRYHESKIKALYENMFGKTITKHRDEGTLSLDLIKFLGQNPPPGYNPLSEDESKAIYRESFPRVQEGILYY